jgi:glycosyltransferase involved in cell wall biosynthesis
MRTKKKALVMLSPGFPSGASDHNCLPERQVMVKAIARNFPGCEMVVLSFQYPFESREYEWEGIKVVSLGGRNRGRIFRLMTWCRAWIWLMRFRKRYDVVGLLSFWLGECAFVASRFARMHGLTHYCWLLGQDARAGNKYVRWSGLKDENLIALSHFLSGEFSRNYGMKPGHIIYGGIDPSLFAPETGSRDIDLVGVGSLIPLKRFEMFLEVVHELKKIKPGVRAVLCGAGPVKQVLEDMVERCELSGSVQLMGEVPHPQVLQLMARSKILLHTSEYEGLGMACLEALHAGAHVVSTCLPFSEPVPHFHYASTTEQLVSTIMKLLEDEQLSHEAVTPFTVSREARKLVQLYSGEAAPPKDNDHEIEGKKTFFPVVKNMEPSGA